MSASSDDRLTINEGETYTVQDGEYEEWSGASVDGQLDIDGSLALVDDPETPGEEPFSVSGGGFTLPLEIQSLRMVTTGFGFLVTGLLATLLGGVVTLKNYAAGVPLMLAFLALVLAGVTGLSLSWFWALVVLTVLTLAVGLVVRGVAG